MKKRNSICEFSSQRSESLLKNFRESIARQSQISAIRAFKDAADAPAPRFWVSEARATRVISMMLKGENITEGMHPQKKLMYDEIYRRVVDLRRQFPDSPLGDIVFEVVNNPAPKSYLTWRWARKLIYEKRKSLNF